MSPPVPSLPPTHRPSGFYRSAVRISIGRDEICPNFRQHPHVPLPSPPCLSLATLALPDTTAQGAGAGRSGLLGTRIGGFSWAAVVGRVVAELLAGREPGCGEDHDLAPFRPDRFAGGETAWTNPFTAGERSHGASAPAPAGPF
jgi:hypothetical protein